MKNSFLSKTCLMTSILMLSSSAVVIAAEGNLKPSVLSLTQAEAIVVAMGHESANCYKVKECFVIVSSESVYTKITFANRVEFDLGNNAKGFRYINGVTLYVNNMSKHIDNVVQNR